MRRLCSLLTLSCCVLVPPAFATTTSYDVTVDTSSLLGTSGFLDFNFNPGPLVTQSASLDILNFTTDGTLGGLCPCGTGDVTGQLPATLTFDNGTGLNDYFDFFTFGSSISFTVSLYGPALSTPDGVSTSGSTFAFSMFADTSPLTPVLTSDTTDGFAFTIDVNLDGTTTVTGYSPQTTVTQEGSSVPEPAAFYVVLLALACIAVRRYLVVAQRPAFPGDARSPTRGSSTRRGASPSPRQREKATAAADTRETIQVIQNHLHLERPVTDLSEKHLYRGSHLLT